MYCHMIDEESLLLIGEPMVVVVTVVPALSQDDANNEKFYQQAMYLVDRGVGEFD